MRDPVSKTKGGDWLRKTLDITLWPPNTHAHMTMHVAKIPSQGTHKQCLSICLRHQKQIQAITSPKFTLGESMHLEDFPTEHRGGIIYKGVGASPPNKPYLKSFHPAGIMASPSLHRWNPTPSPVFSSLKILTPSWRPWAILRQSCRKWLDNQAMGLVSLSTHTRGDINYPETQLGWCFCKRELLNSPGWHLFDGADSLHNNARMLLCLGKCCVEDGYTHIKAFYLFVTVLSFWDKVFLC